MPPKKTKHGTWQVRWRDPKGRQRARSFKRQQDAIAFERETLVDQRRGTWVDPDLSKITVEDWAATWLAGAHNLKPRGKDTYEQALVRILPALGHLQIGRVTDTHIDEYLTALGQEVGPWTVHRHYRVLRRMFRVAVQRGRIPKSPVDAVQEPHVPQEEMRFLTATQLEDLADAIVRKTDDGIDDRYRSLVLVAGWGGLRWGELAALRVGRVDVAGSRVHVVTQFDQAGKRESEPKSLTGRRWVTLPASVTAELAERIDGRAPSDLVWTAPKGGALAHGNFLRRDFWPAAVRAGLGELTPVPGDDEKTHYEGVSPHDLRHTAVALAIADDAHPKTIQLRMGHSKISITLDLYGHLFKGIDEDLGVKLDDTRSAALTERRQLRAV